MEMKKNIIIRDLKEKLEVAKKGLKLVDKNDELKEKNSKLTKTMYRLNEQINKLAQKNSQLIKERIPSLVNTTGDGKANEVQKWLCNIVQLPQYLDGFMEHGFDDLKTIVTMMDDDDLINIGVDKIGHRKRIKMFIAEMKAM